MAKREVPIRLVVNFDDLSCAMTTAKAAISAFNSKLNRRG